jgi:Uma2 family endonuclease
MFLLSLADAGMTTMSSASRHNGSCPADDLPILVSGDRMNQAEFHWRYQAYPEKTKIELVAGTVYMASPLRLPHANFHVLLSWLLGSYIAETPGVQGLDNVSTIPDESNEVQPDLCLRTRTEFGGKTTISSEEYVQGAPELVVEITHSSRSIDLTQKKAVYRKAGVQEYLVLSVEKKELFWFDFRSRHTLKRDKDGVIKSRVYPGLWNTVPGLLDQNQTHMGAVLRAGLQSPEHRAFVKQLQSRRKQST